MLRALDGHADLIGLISGIQAVGDGNQTNAEESQSLDYRIGVADIARQSGQLIDSDRLE